MQENVLFINKYLSLEELFTYLSLTDIYVFTSKDPHQAVSGTFSYALSSGCPIVSTPIPHAREVLEEGLGLLFDFGNHHQLAQNVIRLFREHELRHSMSLNAFYTTRSSAWENVAVMHSEIFRKLVCPGQKVQYTYPPLSFRHLFSMTTAKGLIQFSKLNQPDINSGYTLDDNARALVVLAMYNKVENVFRGEYAEVYLNFIEHCQQNDGSFLNYVDNEKTFTRQNTTDSLEDANGRAIWALGAYLAECYGQDYKLTARAKLMFYKALKNIPVIESPRAMAFVIKGLHLYNSLHKVSSITVLIETLAKKLTSKYYDTFAPDWEWFETYLTYANSLLPEAMLYAYLNSGEEMYRLVAKNSFDFLLQQIFNGEQIKVVSNNGWKQKGKASRKFGEQPIDVAYTIITLQQFHKVFGEEQYARLMDTAFSWFLGNNHLRQTIYDPTTGGCCDGLEEHNVNLNQGAESTVCYLMARLAMEEITKENHRKSLLPIPEMGMTNLLAGSFETQIKGQDPVKTRIANN